MNTKRRSFDYTIESNWRQIPAKLEKKVDKLQ